MFFIIERKTLLRACSKFSFRDEGGSREVYKPLPFLEQRRNLFSGKVERNALPAPDACIVIYTNRCWFLIRCITLHWSTITASNSIWSRIARLTVSPESSINWRKIGCTMTKRLRVCRKLLPTIKAYPTSHKSPTCGQNHAEVWWVGGVCGIR